jgi:hypothetical protein
MVALTVKQTNILQVPILSDLTFAAGVAMCKSTLRLE